MNSLNSKVSLLISIIVEELSLLIVSFIKSSIYIIEFAFASTSVPAFISLEIIYFISIDTFIKGYTFRGFYYVIIKIQLFLLGLSYNLCFDIRYIISLVDRAFIRETCFNVEIRRILTFITIRDINSKKHSTNKYVKLKLYLLEKNEIALIKRELYIVDKLTIKALIEINIMKLEGIIVDLRKNVIRIKVY